MRITHYLPILFSILLIAMASPGCGSQHRLPEGERQRYDSLFRAANEAIHKNDFRKSDSLGDILLKEARESGDRVYEAYGLLARGAYPKTAVGCDDRLNMVRAAEEIAITTDNDTLLSRVYNMLGIYATIYEVNFSRARHYYSEAIKHARRINAENFIIYAECNIAELYHSIGDTLGHTYDLNIYRYALEQDNKVLLIPAAQRCAEYYLENTTHPERAIPYIKSVGEAGNSYLNHLLLGKYYIATDSLPAAFRELDLAIADEDITPGVYLTYGKALNSIGRYQESNRNLHLAEKSYRELESRGLGKIETWRILADNYRHLNEETEALRYLELYINARDSINRIRNMEEINTYKVRFDVEKKELELARNRETMKRQSLTIWSGVVIILLTGAFYLFYRWRRRSLHRLIVRQQTDFLNEHPAPPLPDAGEKEIAAPAAADIADSTDRPKGLSDDKAEEIWRRIENEMEVNHIYSDTTVTRDIFSERIGCNHTWFSQVIKERTGKSYLQFMNSRRIKEALRALSDPELSVTLKELAAQLGFLSPSTFYSTFRQHVGMSPAEYRKLALAEKKRKTRKMSAENAIHCGNQASG